MIVGIADTHIVIWYLTDDRRLSETAGAFMDNTARNGDQIGVSSISLVEIVYLIEKGRIPVESLTSLATALESPRSALVGIPLDLAIARTLPRVDTTDVPDMPDRIIAATALYLDVPVISRDARIQLSDVDTIW